MFPRFYLIIYFFTGIWRAKNMRKMEKEGLSKVLKPFFIKRFFLFCLLATLCQSTQLLAQTEVFKETFDTDASMSRFTILDVNGDGEY